jgi:hypothetical protein
LSRRLGVLAVDGTKLRANASRHKAMSYERMVKKETQLEQEIAALRAQVDAVLADAEATDAAEDEAFGSDRHGDELPDELQRRETRLAAIREAKAALEAEAAAAETARRAELEQQGKTPRTPSGGRDPFKPRPSAQRNFTDPDSKIMKTSDVSAAGGPFELPQFCGGELRAFGERTKLEPGHTGVDEREPDEGVEAAVGSGEHALLADNAGQSHEAVRNNARMLHAVGLDVDHAENDRHLVRQVDVLEDSPLVFVARVGAFGIDRANVGLENLADDALQRHVLVVGPAVVAPTECRRTRSGGMPASAAFSASIASGTWVCQSPTLLPTERQCAAIARSGESIWRLKPASMIALYS